MEKEKEGFKPNVAPDLRGESFESSEIIKMLKVHGVQVQIEDKRKFKGYAPGWIMQQTPEAGAILKRPAIIKVIVTD